MIQTGVSFSLQPPAAHRVVVVGGTHGNEYTGVWCIKALDQQKAQLQRQYPSLDISTLLANPEAHLANKRFIHTDLNREFTEAKLCVTDDDVDDNDDEGLLDTIESARARELDEILGSKCEGEEPDQFDVAVDLHSTTSNMGITLIVNEGDELMAQGAAYVTMKCKNAPVRCLMHAIPVRGHRATLSSAAKHGFTVEVGPVPQGVLRHDMVIKTESALHTFLEFLQRRNEGDDVIKELKECFPTRLVPCFRTAPAKRPGELSGKISWPCDPDNPNFPAVMVHNSLQDRDFHILRIGDPLFVALDGSLIYYDGSHGDEVYVIFVNEAGYYYTSSGTGIGVAVATKFDLLEGMLVDHDQFEEVSSQLE